MIDHQRKLIIGSLLHDIGKLLHRGNDGRIHSQSGYEFLKNEVGITDKDILDQVLYHHGNNLRGSKLSDDSLAYITYIADNIAAGTDRRERQDVESGFSRSMPLQSIFNILNGNSQNFSYAPNTLQSNGEINFPESNNKIFNESFYIKIIDNLKASFLGLEMTDEYVNSLLEVLESNLTYIPSSTSKMEIADVSLFDHVKLTAAISSCIYEYLDNNGIKNYKAELLAGSKEFYEKKVFLLYSMDISGIQDFIYTISSKGALKALRARSFYLEVMMEHLIDEIISKSGLSRASLIYSGGGHAYLLLPNTGNMKSVIERFENEMNQWFLSTFKNALYVAGGYTECSANALRNEPAGSYKEIFRSISSRLSEKKLHRYSAEDIIMLNSEKMQQNDRECSVCRRTDRLTEENKCSICSGLESFSNAILYDSFYSVSTNSNAPASLPLPGDKYLIPETKDKLIERMKSDDGYIRCYSKNGLYTGSKLATKLWIGDYSNGRTFEDLGLAAEGIERIAVLRADVDNLGQAFVAGFENEKTKDLYVTLSRTATFSRKLSIFFKLHMNHILENGEYYLDSTRDKGRRNASIVYSGGDDAFIIGSWDDVIGLAVDLHNRLNKFSQGTLSISAGIGIYHPKYPISAMAKQTGELEELSKGNSGKNSITLFSKDNTYSWDVLIEKVIGEKYGLIERFFSASNERGKNFLYNILELLRNREDKINLARYAYMLSRLEPDENSDTQQRNLYKEFSKKMFLWMKTEEDSREAITALILYTYLTRTKGVEYHD